MFHYVSISKLMHFFIYIGIGQVRRPPSRCHRRCRHRYNNTAHPADCHSYIPHQGLRVSISVIHEETTYPRFYCRLSKCVFSQNHRFYVVSTVKVRRLITRELRGQTLFQRSLADNPHGRTGLRTSRDLPTARPVAAGLVRNVNVHSNHYLLFPKLDVSILSLPVCIP